MDFVLENGLISGPNPWKTLANLAASPTPFPLPGQERHRKTTVRASQRVASHQTRIFCFGKILSFSEVSWGCWRTFWTELWMCFSQHLHMSKRLHVDACLMFEWGPTGAGFDFAFAPPVSFFWPKPPFKSWFALFRRVILSATKNGALIVPSSYMLFPNQGMLCLACTKSWRLLRSWWVDRSERWREESWWTKIWWFQVLVFDTFGRHHFTNIYMFKNMGIFG